MKRIYAAVMVCFLGTSAFAQQTEKPAGAEPITHVSVSLDDCKRLVKHNASADVAYKPGVDVHGKAVKPADIKPLGAIDLPNEIIIDFGLDLAERYGFGAAGSFDATADIAKVKYDLASGGLTFNGKSLLDADSHAVEAACALRLQNEAGQ